MAPGKVIGTRGRKSSAEASTAPTMSHPPGTKARWSWATVAHWASCVKYIKTFGQRITSMALALATNARASASARLHGTKETICRIRGSNSKVSALRWQKYRFWSHAGVARKDHDR